MVETVQLHYVERGKGRPVVLLHGFALDHTIWEAQIQALSEAGWRVIAPDLRGHGQSPIWGGVYAMEALAADVAALLETLGVDRAVWVGHSMGGYVTMAALRAVPEWVEGAALVATHPFADSPEKREERELAAQRVWAEGVQSLADEMLEVLFAPETPPDAPYVQQVAAVMARANPQGVAAALRGMAERPSSVTTLLDARVPMVMVAGAKDQLIPRDVLRRVADQLPPLPIRKIAQAGHMPMVEAPEETSEALVTFLQTLP